MNITLIGLGLIGSSLGLCLKKANPDCRLIGWDQNPDFLRQAHELGAVDQMATTLGQALMSSPVIFLAVPVGASQEILDTLKEFRPDDAVLVTDTGSTKATLVSYADQLFEGTALRFLGGHPMAGSHKSGPSAADPYLFENAYYIFCPGQSSLPEDRSLLENLLAGTGARFVRVEPQEHDRVTSQVSHFPHILATSLMLQAADYNQEHLWTSRLAAGAFRDMTRIAEADAKMWSAILLSNPDSIRERIQDFHLRLQDVEKLIEQGNSAELEVFFESGKHKRQDLKIHKKAGVDSFYDLWISVPDRKDVVLEVLERIRGISLVNLRINEENREDLFGQLQLTFKTLLDRDQAYDRLIQATDFTVKREGE